MESTAMMWFRKGLRIHDNPALDSARRGSKHLFPVFVLDPRYLDPDPTASSPGSALAGVNRIQFLLESLTDLDSRLRRLGSRLLVLRGDPVDVLSRILKDWKIGKLCFEFDTEPYSQNRDSKVKEFAKLSGIKVLNPISHTLFNPADIIQKNGGNPPLTYKSFIALAGEPPAPLVDTYSALPPIGDLGECEVLSIPTIQELGYTDLKQKAFSPFRGGESEALIRLKEYLDNKEWVANFDKPKGDPSAFLKPATTVLSPYLKFGCLSSRYFYQCLNDVCRTAQKHTSPQVSLAGQLLWRDFFYTVAFGTPNFDKMRGNKLCRQIPWRNDGELLIAWKEGRTGYPWIDAIMIQLNKWGWMHHLARHSVACFLTRGDLYHRIYSPITFGKKYDPNGDYIRHFLPVLKDMPKEYIYEPWTAPPSIQEKANCIIGRDYPRPVVDHSSASKECKRRMGAAYAANHPSDVLAGKEKLNNLRRTLDEDEQEETQCRSLKQRKS